MLWSGTPYSSLRLWADRGLQGPNCTKRVAATSLRHQPAIRPPHYRPCTRRQLSGGPGFLTESAPAGHRPTGPGQSRHPPRVRSPGRRYPSLRVIGSVVAAEHMSDGRTRARPACPGQPRCALRARLSGEPDGRGTYGPRDWRFARGPSQTWNLLHWRITAKGRPVNLWPA